MKHVYLAFSVAAFSFFTYAQQHGMQLFSGAVPLAQQGSSYHGSNTVSHK